MKTEGNLKEKTVSGMMWGAVGKVGTLTINFLSNLVLARLLMPEDFDCIGMLAIFLAVSNIFIQGGLGTALIQKKNPTKLDYSTVFYWNLVFAVVFYVILFAIAPAVARFYGLPILQPMLRVQSSVLIIQSFAIVQITQLQKRMDFRALAIRNMAAALAGTLIAIPMAFHGYGAWSLVASAILAAIVNVLLLWKMSDWRPSLEFSFASLKQLFSFGGLMLLSSLAETLYTNLQGLIIGKRFPAGNLGYYMQAKKLEEVPVTGLSSIVNDVTFPAFAKLQDDPDRLLEGMRKSTKALSFVNFPMMILLMIIALPLITLLYGAKWETSAPYFQILCISGLIYTINTLNTNVIKALGKGKIYFAVQIIKRTIGIALIFFGMRYGIYGLLWAVASVSYISFIINALVSKRLINYGIFRQLWDVFPCLLAAATAGVLAYLLGRVLPLNMYVVMLIQIVVYAVLYLLLAKLLKIEGLQTYTDILTNLLHRKN
ncbi:MAG: lipopolysaccharide biosynthesis protein [Bacteroidales bacterium]|nr:lipopolysaccharide biosynthesis protein [Bacteroidales bacterium]